VAQGAIDDSLCNNFPTYWCQAGPGYDGPTGWGTPDGIAGFHLGAVSHSVVTVIGVPYQESTVGLAITPLPMRAVDTASASLTWSAAGLPPGLSIDPATGDISGTPTTVGTYSVAVTATDGSGSSTVHFGWGASDVITFGSGVYNDTVAYGTAVDVQVVASDSAPSEPLTYSASGLAPGLSIDPSTGVISGVMTKTGYWDANITVSDPTGASAVGGYFFQDYGVITVSPISNVTSVAGQPIMFGVQYTDTAPEAVFTNLFGPPGEWTDDVGPAGPVQGWSMVAGVYHAKVDVGDGWGGDGTAQFTWTVLPAPDSGPSGSFRAGGGCLSVPGAHPASGAVVRVARCAATAAQTWRYVQDGTLRIGGLCLLAPGAGMTANASLTIGPCTSADVVSWQVGQGGVLYNPLASGSSLCLTGRVGHRLALEVCKAGLASQAWQMPAGQIGSEMPGRCIGTNGKVAVGKRVISVACTRKSLARWTVSANGTIGSDHLCLAAVKGTAGSPLQLARCGPSSSQQWQLVPGYDGSGQIQARPSGLCVILPSAGAAITLEPCATGAGIEVTGEWWRIQ
jgi:Putative Ig domain/Ricin-type beta-trefoil lectin domain